MTASAGCGGAEARCGSGGEAEEGRAPRHRAGDQGAELRAVCKGVCRAEKQDLGHPLV